MKILRFRKENMIKPGVLDNENNIRDLSDFINESKFKLNSLLR